MTRYPGYFAEPVLILTDWVTETINNYTLINLVEELTRIIFRPLTRGKIKNYDMIILEVFIEYR